MNKSQEVRIQYRNASTLAVSRGFSALGGQIAITILPVVVFLISHSMALSGLVLGTRLLISTISTPISGVLVDRWSPKTLMMVSLSVRIILFAMMAQTRIIPLLAVLAALTAVGGMLESTAVGTLTPRLVSDETLPRTNAIISSALNLAFIVGPLLGGLLVAQAPTAWGFYAAAGSQVVALVGTMCLPSTSNTTVETIARKSVSSQLMDGVKFAFTDRFLRIMLTVYSMFILGLTAFNVLAIGLSFKFHMGSEGYGILIAIQAIGMLAVTFMAAKWLKPSAVVPMFLLNMPIQGIAIVAIALSPTFVFCALFACLQGLGWGMEQASVMTVLQQRIPPEMQGRVFGLFFSALSMAETVGVSVFGWLGGRLGDAPALLIAGTLSLLFAILGIFLLKPLLQRKLV